MLNLQKPGRACGHSWRWQINRLVFFTCLFVFFTATSVSLAHSMDLEVVEEGVLQVKYDEGIPARRAEVAVYDAAGKILASGTVDTEGYFYFDSELPAYGAEAQDGLGHKAELIFGRGTRRLPRALGGFLGVLILLSAAVGGKIINQRRGKV